MTTKLSALGLMLAVGTVFWVSAAIADIKPPAVGQRAEFDCEGPYSKEHIFKIAEANSERIRIERSRDGRAGWTEKPLTAIGLSVFFEQDRNDGKGIRKQSFDDDDLAAYAKLEPGSVHEFNVRERNDNGKWEWGYKIVVDAAKQIDHPILGKIEVVPVIEERQVWGGSYSSKAEVLVYPEKGMSVGWTYEDGKGTMVCELVKLS